MSVCRFTSCVLPTALLLPALCSGQTASAPGLARLYGTTFSPGGAPLGGVQVSVTSLPDGATRILTTAQDGTYEASRLLPGKYQLLATKDSLTGPADHTLELSDGQELRADVTLSPPAAATTGNFFHRFFKAYGNDWKPAAPSADSAAPKFRGEPAAVDGPPFPFSVWPYGGSVVIGQPFTQAAPLMTALWSGSNGDAWKKSGVQIYGWLNAGANVSTSRSGGYSNFPEAYAERAGFELDQEVLYIERQPDTVQTDHIDWGFRVALLYGLDYRFTTANGFLSDQLLNKNRENGFDVPMFYFDLYVPKVAQGMDIRVGRYISLPDVEAQLAPNNYTYSHSLLYTFDCYTQLGLNSTTKLTNHWLLQLGISPGCDTMPWTSSAKVTLNGCLGYTWTEARNNIYVCDNSLNDGRYAYNNLQAFYATWYHKYSKDSRWHSALESWYQYQKDTPNVNNSAGRALLINGANGAVCRSLAQVTCFAPEWAIVNYHEYQANKHNYLSIRNEFFDDFAGQRTGYKTAYSEHTVGWGHWVGTTVLFRPELRWEHSYDALSYNNGTRHSQLTLASDVILFF